MIYLLKHFLRFIARRIIGKYKPKVVAIGGSVGKTFAKEAIYSAIKDARRVRKSAGNLNNELGIPLAIITDTEKENGLKFVTREGEGQGNMLHRAIFWARIILKGAKLIIWRAEYPEILILEYGADRPGDIPYLLTIAVPEIAVVTAIGDIPVHVEFYAGREEMLNEEAKLAEKISSECFAVLNLDDADVYAMREKTRGRVVSFGFNEGAAVQIIKTSHYIRDGVPKGIAVTLKYQKHIAEVVLKGTVGRAPAYAAAAAACVGLILDMELDEIAANISAHFVPPKQRMNLKRGIKRSLIIDDSYNASPLSMRASLEALKELPAKRKVAVIGDMLEIGEYSINAHIEAGSIAARSADVLVAVGTRAKFIAEEAVRAGLHRANVIHVMTAEEAGKKAQDIMQEGDLVLVKASRAIHLEKVVEEIEEK